MNMQSVCVRVSSWSSVEKRVCVFEKKPDGSLARVTSVAFIIHPQLTRPALQLSAGRFSGF